MMYYEYVDHNVSSHIKKVVISEQQIIDRYYGYSNINVDKFVVEWLVIHFAYFIGDL